MPFWRFAVIVVMLTTFTATLRFRLLDVRYTPAGISAVTATVAESAERFFVLPAPLRPEEGIVETAAPIVDVAVRPAYAIATIVGTIGVMAVATRDALPKLVGRILSDYPAALPVLLIGLAMLVRTAVAATQSRRLSNDTDGDDGSCPPF